jgi:phospholipid/cholesterol/gamma-HCH transport system substrate-binding protein
MANRIRQGWEQARNIPGLGGNLLAVAVILLIGIVATVYLLPHYRVDWPWTSKVRFSAVVEEAPGMKASGKHAVNIAGIEVGQVTDVEPAAGGHATLTMSVDPAFPVYRNAKLQVQSVAPINDVVVELDQGTPDAGPIDGGTIPMSQTSRFIQPDEVLGKLDDRTQSAVTQLLDQSDVALHDAPHDLAPGLNATDGTLASLQPVVASLRTRHDAIAQLVTDLSTISQAAGGDDKRLASLVTNLQGTLDTLTQRDDALGASVGKLPGVTASLRNAMSSATDLTTQLNPTLDDLHDASDALPPALEKLTDTVHDAGPLVQAARPVVQKAGPLVSDLRPLVGNVDTALGHLKPVTCELVPATAEIAPWMPNLAAFVYQTSSSFSIADANGGFGRANIDVDLTDPTGGEKPQPEVGSRGPVHGSCR